jgi:hypothetical protein
MRRTGIVCVCALVVAMTAVVAAASELDGTWEGSTEDGSPVRIDGRPADLVVRADTLLVRFDAPAQAGPQATRETAVYRFLLGKAQRNPARLFVYGFDLGPQGLYLVRTSEPPAPAEDTAPPVPSAGGAGKRAAAGSIPGPQARSNDR